MRENPLTDIAAVFKPLPPTPLSVRRTALYRHYDADDRLLYVGISAHLAARTFDHSRESPWVARAVRISGTWYPDRAAALAAERAAILTEEPEFNSTVKLGAARPTRVATATVDGRRKLDVRLSWLLVDNLDERAAAEGIDRSELIRRLLKFGLAAMPRGWKL